MARTPTEIILDSLWSIKFQSMDKDEFDKKVSPLLSSLTARVREEERKSILEAYKQTTGIEDDIFIKSLSQSTKEASNRFTIFEDDDYDGCYNIYDNERSCTRVKYFCEDDDENKQRAEKWVSEQLKG